MSTTITPTTESMKVALYAITNNGTTNNSQRYLGVVTWNTLSLFRGQHIQQRKTGDIYVVEEIERPFDDGQHQVYTNIVYVKFLINAKVKAQEEAMFEEWYQQFGGKLAAPFRYQPGKLYNYHRESIEITNGPMRAHAPGRLEITERR